MSTSVARTLLSLGLAVGAAGAGAAPAAATGPPASSPAGAAAPASGAFAIVLDEVLGVEPVLGGRCELTGISTLTLSGTLSGSAQGTSTVTIFAPCEEATTSPPGTYFDHFSFEGAFEGTVHGETATGTITYWGITRPGGEIDNALVKLRGGAWATLKVDAAPDAGVFAGTYDGRAKR